MGPHDFQGRLVGLEVVDSRFVGYVEEYPLFELFIGEEPGEPGQESLEKVTILRGIRRGVPAENPPVFTA